MRITKREAKQVHRLLNLAADIDKGPSGLRVTVRIDYPNGTRTEWEPYERDGRQEVASRA